MALQFRRHVPLQFRRYVASTRRNPFHMAVAAPDVSTGRTRAV
jgi:hypothetical protein